MMTAAGGEAPLNVEDVFSSYVFRGTGNSTSVKNNISLTSFNFVEDEYQSANYFKSKYYFGRYVIDDPFGSATSHGKNFDFLASDSTYIYGEHQSDFYYSTDGSSWTQMTYNPQASPSVSSSAGMCMSSNGNLVVAHLNTSTGYESISVTSDRGATNWLGPYLISSSNNFVSPIKLLNGRLYGILDNNTIMYNANSAGTGTWSTGGSVSGARSITYLNSGVYIVGANNGYIHTSTSGTGAWTQQSQITSDTYGIRGLVSDGTTAYALSTDGVWSSTNGTTWTKIKNHGMPYKGNPHNVQVDLDTTNNVILFGDHGGTLSLNSESHGGMLWIKNRTEVDSHSIFDTERNTDSVLRSDLTNGESTSANNLGSINFDGFRTSTNSKSGGKNNIDYASWTFRKAPKFFDIQTYTGTGANQTISHNLGSTPGAIIVKRLDGNTGSLNWAVQHRSSINTDGVLYLNLANAEANGFGTVWNGRATSTAFTVGTSTAANTSGASYIAYIFAHNDGDGNFGPTGDQDIIKCGSYTGNSSTPPSIDLGFQPDFLLIKNASSSADWSIVDRSRGLHWDRYNTQPDPRIYPNSSGAEILGFDSGIVPEKTGFSLGTTSLSQYNTNGNDYVYIAIRRGPMKTVEAATEVFDLAARSGNGSSARIISTNLFQVDMTMIADRSQNTSKFGIVNRNLGTAFLRTAENNIGSKDSSTFKDSCWNKKQNAIEVGNYTIVNTSGRSYIDYYFREAEGFFDIVNYKGNAVDNRTIGHNLGSVPQMIWVKQLSTTARSWQVYHADIDGWSTSDPKSLVLDTDVYASTDNGFMFPARPTSTDFTISFRNDVNENDTYAFYQAYIFGEIAGVSDCGSYTGNGTSQTIDCGFSAGARLVLIKRTDSSGNWCIFDSARGIVAGNDPLQNLDRTNAESSFTAQDHIDPDNSGFTVNQVSMSNINVSSAKYIYWAIA